MPSFSLFSSFRRRQAEPAILDESELSPLSSLEDQPEGDPDVTGWPFPAWTRYRFEGFLGKGAMGRVYRAFDPVLNRSVALKILGDGMMPYADRFRSEARAMARVDHPNVAKVFEVGEVEGRPYLAMQLLHGESLHGLRGKLGLEERVELMRQACEGVQAAHRMGLLHRDIKPSNIVVERDADDCWHAFVVDFGLACDAVMTEVASGAKTEKSESAIDEAVPVQAHVGLAGQEAPTAVSATGYGNITGTPAFMSPEQAAGEALDRRSDVFSLGSTLYAVLVGVAPFGGQSILSILANVALTRPASLQDFGGKFPQDLEAIVLKAMEKDPLRRYPSAKALSLDLERWLNGEAVEAVQRQPLYRLSRWIRKNRSLTGLGLLLILTVLGVIGLGVRANWRARAQARYYQYFYQEAERMEAKLTLAEAKPLHDTVKVRQAIQAQMLEIEKIMARAGSVAEAPGHYALGRGYLVLEKWQKARQALEQAWALGLQTPEVASALGYCLNRLYAQGLEGLYGRTLWERKENLDAELKPMILKYLAIARPGMHGTDVDFLEAQFAMAEGRYEEAQAKADQVMKKDPHYVRALLLKADICQAQGEALVRGEAYLEQAKALLLRARDIARSSSAIYEKLAQMHLKDMARATYQAKPFLGRFDQVLDTVRLARQANSHSHRAWEIEAKAWRHSREEVSAWYWHGRKEWAQYPEVMRHAIACADRALALETDSPLALNEKGVALWYLSEWNRIHGLEHQADMDQAIEHFLKALRQPNPMDFLYMNLASCYAIRGNGKQERGVNPLPDFRKALEYYKLCDRRPNNDMLFHNLSVSFKEIAGILRWQGQDTEAAIKDTIEYSRRLLAGAQDFTGRHTLASGYLLKAEYAAWQGVVDQDSLRLGMEHAKQAMALQPESPNALYCMVSAILLDSFTGGEKPDLKTAEKMIAQQRGTQKGIHQSFYDYAWLGLEQYRSKPSWKAFLALEGRVEQGLKLPSANPELHFLAFEACRVALEKKAPGAAPEQWRSRMKEHILRAKQMNPLITPLADKLLKERGGVRE